jgi:hypothetical protein
VPRVEFACCRVRGDGDLTVAQLSRAALRLLSGPAACTGRQLVCLHGMGHPPPPASWGRCLRAGIAPRGTVCALVGDGDCSCERAAFHARRRLIVRDRDLLCEAETRRRGFL